MATSAPIGGRSGDIRAYGALLGFGLLLVIAPPTKADDAWNPFAEADKRAANRAARQPAPAAAEAEADRRPYLAPMTGAPRVYRAPGGDGAPGGYGGGSVPQPYPATPPGYGSAGTYQPPEFVPPPNGRGPIDGGSGGRGAGGGRPGVPYGAPGSYIPGSPAGAQSVGSAATAVERGELAPVVSAEGRLANGIWQGLGAAAAEQLLGGASLPPASPALAELFARVMTEPAGEPMLDTVQLAALMKAGRFEGAAASPPSGASAARDPASAVQAVVVAQFELARGQNEQGCRHIKEVVAAQAKLPKTVKGEAIVTAGYCAIVAGNRKAGGLAAELARDAGYGNGFTIAALEAIASGEQVRMPASRPATMLDGLLVRQLAKPDPALIDALLAKASPGFVQLVASDPNGDATVRLKAVERAVAANVVSPAVLAEAYRAAGEEARDQASDKAGAALERARLFVEAERQQAQFAKTRAVRALIDSARRDGLYHPVAVAVAPIIGALRPAQEIAWFTETAIEVLAAGGDYRNARVWIAAAQQAGGGGLRDHWLMLLDIADPDVGDDGRGRSILALENLGRQGRFSQPALHRLVTVLDALDYNVPIPLWNLASRTQQPQDGHLPATGFLTSLKQASEKRQVAATVLYAMRTIAPQGTSATHLLGLGETIRALKRVGLERQARRLGFEALFGDWPRAG